MKFSPSEKRRALALAYAAKAAKLVSDSALPDLFEAALREGEATSLARAIELAEGRKDYSWSETLRTLLPEGP